jgi:hypothetical protein
MMRLGSGNDLDRVALASTASLAGLEIFMPAMRTTA